MEFVRETAAIGAVLCLLTFVRWALGRYRMGERSRSGQLRSMGRLRLSDQLVLHLVDCDGARFLLTEHKSSCSVLRLTAGVDDRRANLPEANLQLAASGLSRAAGQRGVF